METTIMWLYRVHFEGLMTVLMGVPSTQLDTASSWGSSHGPAPPTPILKAGHTQDALEFHHQEQRLRFGV